MFIVALAFAMAMITTAIACFLVGGYVLGTIMDPINSTAFALINGTGFSYDRVNGYIDFSLTTFGVMGVFIVAWWLLYIYLKAGEQEYITAGAWG